MTSDGTTLLGGDDKAGIAVIMAAAAYLAEHPELPHGPVHLLFTCDEEIGRGVEHVDVATLGAVAAYTLDGPGADKIDVETFSADLATVTIRGINIHPSIAKGRMINAIRAAADFLDRMPIDTLSPERTDGRDGFLHPYTVEGGVGEVKIKILLRDFEFSRLEEQAELLRRLRETEDRFQGAAVQVETAPISQHAGRFAARTACGGHAQRPAQARARTAIGDHSRWHGWFAVHRARIAHPQSLDRAAQPPFTSGMGLSGRNGTSCRNAGGIGQAVGRICRRSIP